MYLFLLENEQMHFIGAKVTTRDQTFKANDVVSYRFVKIYIEWYSDMLKFFAEKMWVAFAVQKLLTFF